jgi:hypothetical protein
VPVLEGRDDPAPLEQVEDPRGNGDPVVDIVAEEETGTLWSLAHGGEGVEGAPGGKDEPLDLERLEDDLSAGVVLVLAESRMGGDGARPEGGESQDEAPGADVPGRRDGQAGRLQRALESRGIEVPRVLGLLPCTGVSPFSPQKEPGSGERACRGKGVSVED